MALWARDGQPLAEFSWQGKDERDDASGRGWAVIEGRGTLAGRIDFHQGDDSAFARDASGQRPATSTEGQSSAPKGVARDRERLAAAGIIA